MNAYLECPTIKTKSFSIWLIRKAVNATDKAMGTIEGFVGETGVLRIDISSDFEKASCLSEIFEFAKDNFYEFFGNEVIVTKVVPGATERRKALNSSGWEFIDKYREHHDYYKIICKQ